MQGASEEEKQRMMAMMMRSGMRPGMGGQQQQFAPPPNLPEAEFQSVSYAPMKDESRLLTGKKKKQPKEPKQRTEAGGPGSMAKSTPEQEMAMEQALMQNAPVEMHPALKKKKWPWQ